MQLLSYALAGLQRRSLNDFNSDDDEPLYEGARAAHLPAVVLHGYSIRINACVSVWRCIDLEARATKPAKRTFGFSGTKSKPARPINRYVHTHIICFF